jgi:leader peptidase (prepilin peptidase)/N-methyltransferase
MTAPMLAPVVVTLLGLLVGSFLNVCIYRLPRGESVVWPGSRCPACRRALAWFENVPVVGWLALGGRCRTCRARIPAHYPLVEAVTGVLFLAAFLVYGPTPLLAVRAAFLCALVVLFMIDLEHQILPDAITLPGVVLGLAASVFLPPGWQASLLGLAVGGLFPFLVAEAYFRLRGREGMGMGDFKMLAMVGAVLGWPLVWIVLILSCVLGIIIGGGALVVTRRGLATRIPFGTFIAVAAAVGTLLGDPAVVVYERLLDAYQVWVFGGR